MQQNLYPNGHNPYYIVTPPYSRYSAGIKVLHLLCHHLNLRGYPSYLIYWHNTFLKDLNHETGIDFLTPTLSKTTFESHIQSGRRPIIIYPEIISGNPTNAECITRYILNYPSLLGGDETFDKNELIFSYSKKLADYVGCKDNILFLPASDIRIFSPSTDSIKRKGTCFYASKYRALGGVDFSEIPHDSVEITSGKQNSQSPKEIANLFRKSEVFYTYENTSLAIEAVLCCCPTVFLPNDHLKEIIASEELGLDGIAWTNSPEQIDLAKKTVHQAYNKYITSINNFYNSLQSFITKTQNIALVSAPSQEFYNKMISILSYDYKEPSQIFGLKRFWNQYIRLKLNDTKSS